MVAETLARELRSEQVRIAEQATAEMLAIFGSLNFTQIDTSAPGFIEAAVSVAERRHSEGVVLGGDMYLSMRREAGVAGQYATAQPVMDAAQLRHDLIVLGPVAAKKLMSRGIRIPEAAQRVFTLTSGRVSKAALAGVRDTISGTTVRDSQAIAYARQTSADACDFCIMLAANTYRDASTALYAAGSRKRAKNPQPSGATFHDHCRCTLITLFNGQVPEAAKSEQERLRAWAEASRQGMGFREFADKAGISLGY